MGALATSTTLDALRIAIVVAEDKSPKWYIDDIQFEQTGTPIAYTVRPDKGTWLWVDSIKVTFADAYAGTVASGTLPSIPYDSLFGVSALANGLILVVNNGHRVPFGGTVKKFIDIMQFPGSEVVGYGSDGTNSWVSVVFKMSEPFLLKAEKNYSMSITLSEDLSGLLYMRWCAGCREEQR